MPVTSEQYEAALARAAAIARRVSAWIRFDNPHPDLLDRAHAALLDEFANDPFGEPSNLAELLNRHEEQSDALCRAENERDARAKACAETWSAIVGMVQPEEARR